MSDAEKPLHVRVAKALGWARLSNGRAYSAPEWTGVPPNESLAVLVPRYDTDWSFIGPLIEKHEMAIFPEAPGLWAATEYRYELYDQYGPTPLVAVCNLLLALKEAGKL